ncbi:MAG: arylsulfotransferase family protein, partial [Pirellulales bacterium]
VAEDGTIYALEKETHDSPPEGFEGIRVPCELDSLLALSPDGKLLRKPIPILSAFRDSSYAVLLATAEQPAKEIKPPPGSTAPQITRHPLNDDNDPLHTNCVRVLGRDLAAQFPQFKAGHVLISVRNLNVIAMLDPIAGRVEWAARGPWLAQHDPQFLENGHLLIFDNLGSPSGSRVLEYDPRTQSLPWSYPAKGEHRFYTSERGMNQRLPNGNTFVVVSEGARMFEVTSSGEMVWSYSLDHFIASGRRYAPEQLRFLPPGIRPRP